MSPDGQPTLHRDSRSVTLVAARPPRGDETRPRSDPRARNQDQTLRRSPVSEMQATQGVNPYREAFYSRQAEWHGYAGADDVRGRHEQRVPYYRWYTKGWLDLPRSTPILDIGCGSGQFLYFLRSRCRGWALTEGGRAIPWCTIGSR